MRSPTCLHMSVVNKRTIVRTIFRCFKLASFIYPFFKTIFQLPPPETHNGPLRGFKIAYRLAGVSASTFIIKKIANSAATQGNIDGLVQWTAYEIKVQAYNDAGDGTFSNPITVTTAEGGEWWRLNQYVRTRICRFSSDIQTGGKTGCCFCVISQAKIQKLFWKFSLFSILWKSTRYYFRFFFFI